MFSCYTQNMVMIIPYILVGNYFHIEYDVLTQDVAKYFSHNVCVFNYQEIITTETPV